MNYAGQSQKAGIARTFVTLSGRVGDHSVQGFHSLSAGGIDKSHLPAHAGKRFPKFPIPIPIIRLARLAVAKESQGYGLGEFILMDALRVF